MGFDLEGQHSAPEEHWFAKGYRKFSYVWSVALLIFALTITFYTVIKEWTNPPWDHVHPVVEVIIFILMLTWIALLEGCQISIVGLQGIDIEKYKDSHPRAYKCCKWVHRGPNVERFLVGRQFLLLFNGFLVTKVAGADGAIEDFYIGDWEWTSPATSFFWKNSVLLMIVIIVPGQLVSQLIAANKMLGFFDLRFFGYYTVLWPCMFVESIGLTHSSYFLKDVLAKIARIDPNEADPEKKINKNFFHYARVLLSIAAVIFSGVFIVKGLANKQTNATDGEGWKDLPGWLAIILTLFFLFIMACAEGLQVSAIALAKTPTSEFKNRAPLAHRTCQVLYTGRNMQAFLVGRQTMVAMMIVLLARVTSYAGSEGVLLPGGDWGMPSWFNEWLLQTGFLGAILVVNVAQLASQVTASIFPIAFINNVILYILLRIMLFIEASGIVNACWPLSWGVDALLRIPEDPFEGDENVKTHAQNIIDRKTSLGLPVSKASPFDLHGYDNDAVKFNPTFE